MARILDSWDTARGDPDKDIHFAIELRTLFDSLEQSEDLSEDTRIHLDEMEGEYLLPELVSNLDDWYTEEDFQSAREALTLLQEGIDDAFDNNWLQVAAQYYHRLICLKAGLQGHEVNDEAEQALDFLEENYPKVSSQFVIPIIEIVLKNTDDLSASELDNWDDLVDDIASYYHSKRQFDRSREFLRILYQLRDQRDDHTSDVEEELIQSYREEADKAETDSSLRKSDILQSGVNECAPYMNDQLKREWKQEALQARRQGTEEELVELSPDELDVDGIDGESLEEAVVQEMEDITQAYVDWFKDLKEISGSGTYALYCLALSPSLIPDPNRIRLSTEEYVFSQLVQRQIISPEAHTYSVDPSDVDTIPRSYRHTAMSKMSSLGNALYRLMKEGHLKATDFIELFSVGDSLTPDTEAFLTDALFETFDDNHVESFFILIPHLEAVIVDTLRSVGRPAYIITEQGTQQQLLGGLFIEYDDLLGSDYSMYLRFRYTSREGDNLRNRLSHGQLRYRNASYLNSVLTLFDITKCMISINISSYLARYSIPNRTLSPSTYYQKETDLSLFTDLNHQTIGYGRSADQHSLLVFREDRHDGVTEIFLDKGRIDRFRVEGVGLTREEIQTKIDGLREENPGIPDDIEYTWLDQGDIILQSILEIIEEETSSHSDPLDKKELFEQARSRGIDESTARFALTRLEESDEIEQSEETVSLS